MENLKQDMNKIEKAVNNFVKELGVKAFFSDSFFAETEKNRVAFACLVGEESNNLFMENWAECHPEIVDCGLTSFTLSLLHEVGHCCDPYDEPAEENDIREECDEISIAGETEKANLKYFELPSEKKATAWANEFIKYHLDECRAFDKMITTSIVQFLQKYLDEDEKIC